MKSPEDIKKTLRCGVNMRDGDCTKYPYQAYGCLESCCMDALEYIEQLESLLAQVEKERDAALKDLKLIGECWYCKHDKLNTKEYAPEVCRRCCSKNNFEWRGICEEE